MPGAENESMLAVLTTEMDGFCSAGMHSEDVSVTCSPLGGVPVAVPVLHSEPWSTSLWVVV